MSPVEVLVAGAGPAGLAAALAAARAGASVLVIEEQPVPGGMGSAAQVHTFCGLYRLHGEEPVFANGGLAEELPVRLMEAGAAAARPVRMGKLWVLPHDPARYARKAARWLEGIGVTARYRVSVTGAETDSGRVRAVTLSDGTRVEARAFVDCTGDAALAHAAGAETCMAEGARLQRPAVILRLAGVPAEWLEAAGRLALAGSVAEAVRAGTLPRAALGAAFRGGMEVDTAWCTVDLQAGGEGWDPLEKTGRAALETESRALGAELCAHLSKVTGAPVSVSSWPLRPGVRESRRVTGEHILTGDEVLRGAEFADGIAEITWPMEFRETATGPKFRWPERPGQIPLRSLRARDFTNLLAAGRCLSCDHEAQAAIRVMGLCLATGEAAGRAAAQLALS